MKSKTSPKKPAAGKTAPGAAADPRFEPVAKALAKSPGFTLMESKSKAMRGMMRDGKSFGMSQHGRFIVKLDEERVAALVAGKVGEPLRHGSGVMKGWLEVTDPKVSWVKLAREAYDLAGAGAKSGSARRRK